MKRVLLTGGSGFIGRNLAEALKKNYEIYAPSHKELDLADYNALASYIKKNNIESVVHGAVHVPMVNGAENEFFNDMIMFMNLEKVSHELDKLIYFGSGAEYDKRYHIRNVCETDLGASIPNTNYGLAKYTMNTIARKSDNIYNLRLFGIFGKYELWQIKFISNLCCKAVFDLPLTIRKDCAFNYIFIEDLPDIVSRFLDGNPRYHDYNVCHSKSYLLRELADMVKEASGKSLEIQLLSDEKNLDYTANNGRLMGEFPQIHITPMRDAIHALFAYYESNRQLIDFEILKSSR